MAVLLVGGFFRSLQFTALNAIGYADIEQPTMSRATSFAAVGQQLSCRRASSLGAAALESGARLHGGGALRLADFDAGLSHRGGVVASSCRSSGPSENAGADGRTRASSRGERRVEGPTGAVA